MHALSIFGVKVWALNIEKKSAVRPCKTWQDNQKSSPVGCSGQCCSEDPQFAKSELLHPSGHSLSHGRLSGIMTPFRLQMMGCLSTLPCLEGLGCARECPEHVFLSDCMMPLAAANLSFDNGFSTRWFGLRFWPDQGQAEKGKTQKT